MSNTTAKRVLPPKLMNRVIACAILFLDSARKEKIVQIAESNGIDLNDAAIVYTIGALKAAKRRGTAKSYTQALDQLEDEQVGDGRSFITKTIVADKLAREINKINRINAGVCFTTDGVHYCHDYNNIVNVDGKTEVIPHFEITEAKTEAKPRPAKVLGTLYAEWEEKQKKCDPLEVMINEGIERNLKLFFADYASRLSSTAKKRLYQLAKSEVDPSYIMADSAIRTDPDPAVRKLANATVRTLYPSFPQKDSVSGIEYIHLVRQYVSPPVELT